jgi:regulator of sigma D
MSRRAIVNELHKPARKNFKRRRVIVKGINDLLQGDLVEMIPYYRENKNYKYLLTVINAFSKYAYAIPIKNKSGQEVTNAMAKILSGLTSSPKNLHTDDGREFFNKTFKALMQKYGINHYSTYSGLKSSIVERFNRTIKNKMWKQFSLQGSHKWIDILEKLVNQYNNTTHSTIKMKPSEVNEKNEKTLLKTVYNHMKIFSDGKFKIGDYVRISKNRQIFDKSYTPNWTTEIFKVIKIQITNPVTYLLEDYQKNFIKGSFYEQELQKVRYPDTYLVEKVLKRRANESYVKWLGFDNVHNSWVNNRDII